MNMRSRQSILSSLWIIMFSLLQSSPMFARSGGAAALAFQFSNCQRYAIGSSRLFASKKKASSKLFRADRVVANRSGMSRTEAFQLLHDRRIFQKNSEGVFDPITGPSTKIDMNTDLYIDRTTPISRPPPLLSVYHKPKWVLSVRKDPQDRPCVNNILTDQHPVGRLDYDSSGLLLFSSSGPLTQYLLHPKHAISKEYVAVVVGAVDEVALQKQLAEGVKTGEGVHTADLLDVQHFESSHAVAEYLQTARSNLAPEYNQTDLKLKGYLDVFDATELSTVRLVVAEGKHRMVRRMLANCGHAVVDLQRQRLGAVELRDLPVGETRDLDQEELQWAHELIRQNAKAPKPKYVKKAIREKRAETAESEDLLGATKKKKQKKRQESQ